MVPDAGDGASAPREEWTGGELTRIVRQLELGDADAPLARKRERVTKAYDSMMVRLERVYAEQGHAPLLADETELRKIDLLVPRHLGPLNGLAHRLRMWWNAAKHKRDQWAHPPSDKEVHRLVTEVIAELDGLANAGRGSRNGVRSMHRQNCLNCGLEGHISRECDAHCSECGVTVCPGTHGGVCVVATSSPLPPISDVFNARKMPVNPRVYACLRTVWAKHNALCGDDSNYCSNEGGLSAS